MKHRRLTHSERELLSRWKREGLSNYDCAKRLSRHVSTIGRELNRNKTRVSVGKDWKIIYEPFHAQQMAEDKKQNAFAAKHPLKNKKIYSYVLEHLRGGWSPEQISGRLREVDHKGEKDWHAWKQFISLSTRKKLM